MVRSTIDRPAELTPADLEPVRRLVGAGCIDYVIVIDYFHFLNRIVGMLGVPAEFLPALLRRFGRLRTAMVFLAGWAISGSNLANRTYEASFEQVLAEIRPIFTRVTGRDPEIEFAGLRDRPKMVESLGMHISERENRSTLDGGTRATIDHTVEATLAGREGRPSTAVEELAVIGTRFAHRTTPGLIGALRAEGWDDPGILDLAIAVADANRWARTRRLLGLDPSLNGSRPSFGATLRNSEGALPDDR